MVPFWGYPADSHQLLYRACAMKNIPTPSQTGSRIPNCYGSISDFVLFF